MFMSHFEKFIMCYGVLYCVAKEIDCHHQMFIIGESWEI